MTAFYQNNVLQIKGSGNKIIKTNDKLQNVHILFPYYSRNMENPHKKRPRDCGSMGYHNGLGKCRSKPPCM